MSSKKNTQKSKPALETYHRFLDEAGDTAFYGKGKTPIIGVKVVFRCVLC